jgi:hypothetical protein
MKKSLVGSFIFIDTSVLPTATQYIELCATLFGWRKCADGIYHYIA